MARCYTPVSIKNPAYQKRAGSQPFTIEVPCGKCYACVQNRRVAWSIRLKEERRNSCSSYFITLTYDNNSVPVGGVCVKDVQDYIKRLRRLLQTYGLSKAYPIKYFVCAEYGSSTLRPHYHMLLFNFPPDFVHEIVGCWRKGFVYVSDNVGDQSIMYTTKYMLGCAVSDDDTSKYSEPAMPTKLLSIDGVLLNEPFTLMSKGLGKSYISRMKHWHEDSFDRHFVPDAGYKLTMPRYYRDKIFSAVHMEEYRLLMQVKNDDLVNAKTHDDHVLDVLTAVDASRKLKRQRFETKLKNKI